MTAISLNGHKSRNFAPIYEGKITGILRGISLLGEGASIAFVCTWGSPTPCLSNANTGRSPNPLWSNTRQSGRKYRRNYLNKDTTFSIRISTQDLEKIKAKAAQACLSQSEYVTRCCLGRQVVVLDGLKDVLKQLSAIGNNLNQLTALANMGRILIVNLDGTVQALAEIRNAIREIAERGRWSK
jgi:hypothetical protein